MSLSQPATQKVSTAAMSTAGLQFFFNVTGPEHWKLSQDEQCQLLGISSRSTLHGWKKKVESGAPVQLSHDTLERLSLLMGIRKGVEILEERRDWDDYMRRPNRAFGGRSALQRMLAGNVSDLLDVRRYLDSWRGAHFG